MKIRVGSSRDTDRMLVRAANIVCLLIVLLMVASVAARSVSAALPKISVRFEERGARPGIVLPAQATAIHAESAARVAAVLIQPGDLVAPDQLLVELENEELATLAEAARTRFNQAQRRLASAERRRLTGIRSQIHKERYALALRQWNGSQQRLAAFSLTEYENALRTARARLDRIKAQQDGTPAQIERAERLVSRESRNLEQARLQWSLLRQQADIADGRLKIEKALLELEDSNEIASARAAYQDALLDLRVTRQRAGHLRVTAPRAGTVLAAPANAGDRVFEGAPLVHLADLSSLEVNVPMPASLVRHVAPGDPVAVRLPLDRNLDLAAAVSAVSTVPDPVSHAYPVRIQIGNPKPGQILAGLECAVTFPKINAATKPWWRRMLGL